MIMVGPLQGVQVVPTQAVLANHEDLPALARLLMTEPTIEDPDHRDHTLVLHAIVLTAGKCWDRLPLTATKADGL